MPINFCICASAKIHHQYSFRNALRCFEMHLKTIGCDCVERWMYRTGPPVLRLRQAPSLASGVCLISGKPLFCDASNFANTIFGSLG